MVGDLDPPAFILITEAAHSGTVISSTGLDVNICLLFRIFFLRPLAAGVSVVEVKASLHVARERLPVFGANTRFALRRGIGASSGGIGEIDTMKPWGVFSSVCLSCFFLSSLRLSSSDDPSTLHQLPGGRLLRLSGSSGSGCCSSDSLGVAAVGRLDFFPPVPCWYIF